MKLTIGKTTAEGEAITVEIQGKDAGDVEPKMRSALKMLDLRLLEMNKRVAEATMLNRSLSPEVQMAVAEVIEVLRGVKRLPEPVAPATQPHEVTDEEARKIVESVTRPDPDEPPFDPPVES